MEQRRVLLALLACILAGCLLGAGGYTFLFAEGASYLSDRPSTCVNCHVMREHFDGWQRASHHAAATCNDCHLPQDGLFAKWRVKASNGYHHSRAFTLQDFPDPIHIKPDNARVLEANCLRCHAELTDALTRHGPLGVPTDPEGGADLHGCVRCHGDVGHGPRR